MPRTISQKRSAIRRRVSYRFWHDIYDRLRALKLSPEQMSRTMTLMFECMDGRELFKYQRQAFYDLQSLKQILIDFELPVSDPPKYWIWPELEANKSE